MAALLRIRPARASTSTGPLRSTRTRWGTESMSLRQAAPAHTCPAREMRAARQVLPRRRRSMSASLPWCACDRLAANPAPAGYYQADAIQNITGTLRLSTSIGGIQAGGAAGGAFGEGGTARSQIINGSSGTSNDILLDASRVVRTSSETRGAASRVLPVVLI